MAWKARLIPPGVVAVGDKLQMSFEYFDDVTPAQILATEGFQFPISWSAAEMQEVVQQRGQAFRAARARATTLAGQFPHTTTVLNVP